MLKNKYVIGVLAGWLIVGLSVGGVVLWHKHTRSQKVSFGAASINADSTSSSLAGNGPAAASGLSVDTSAGAQNLGQLTGSGQSGAQGTSSRSSNSSSSGSSSQGLDPSTFSQYDKYANNPSALFGDMQVGTGTELTANHQASVYYKGWLTNGTLFDQSRTGSDGKLQPFSFTLGAHQVIPGWEEGVNGMKVGGTRLIVVPPGLGYGSQGQGSIPPNSVLVFEVQLVAVQ